MSLPISVVREIAESRTVRELIMYYTSLSLGIGTVLVVFLWLRSRQGLALTAIRDSKPRREASASISSARNWPSISLPHSSRDWLAR